MSKNGMSTIYDVLVNVARGHQDGMRAYAAHAIGTPTTKVGKAFGVANVLIGAAAFTIGMIYINLKAAEAGARLGERMEKKIRALKKRNESIEKKLNALKNRTAAKAAMSDEAKESLENYISECRNKFSLDAMEAMADRAVKRAESRDLTDEEAEELGL